MNNLFTTLVTGLALLFTLSMQANSTIPAFPTHKADHKISTNGMTDLMDDFIISATTVPGDVGDNVCIDVSSENFDNILSFQYSINFDENVLQYDTILDPEVIPDLNFGVTTAANGDIGVSWFDNDIDGVTIPDGSILYQICFDIIGGSGISPVSFSGMPTVIEVVDGDENIIPFDSNSGGVNINGVPILSVSAPTLTANNGDNVCLDIIANGFDNLASFSYNVTFDPTVLTFTQNMDAGSLTGLTFNNSDAANGNLSVSWTSGSGVTLANGTSIYQACFDVIGAGGTSSSYAFLGGMATDGAGATVAFTGNNGTVNIMATNNGTDFTVIAATPTGNVGDIVCVDVTVENFDNILSFQYSINFDPTLLEFNEIIDPENIDDLNFGESGVANGNIGVSWFDGDVVGITVPDGTLLYQVCFTVLGGNGVVPVTFSGSPTTIEVVDGNEDPVIFTSVGGGVNVGGVPPGASVTIAAATVTAENGDNVCLDITVNSFTNIASLAYNVTFDSAVLTFTQNMDAGNLTGLTFDNSGAASGNLSISWTSGTGVTLSNGTMIYQACFNVIGAGGTSSSYAFSGGTSTDGDGDNITFNGNNGTVNVMTQNNGTDFIVTASTEGGNVGETVCIDVTVENFNNILSFQYSMNFDATLLQFVEVIDPENIDDLNFGESGVANGNLGISWFDNDVTGITIPDGTLLYQVCFTVLDDNNGNVIPVTFSGMPTAIEVVDGNEDPIVFTSVSGGIGGNPPAPTVTFSAPTVMAENGDNVCVDITANGFMDLTNFQYTMNFDASVLAFDQNINGGNLSNIMFDNSGAASGNLAVTWNSGTGVTLANGTTLYQVCFNVIGAGGTSSSLIFGGNPSATDSNAAAVIVNTNNGQINVMAPNNGTDFIVTGSDTSGEIGDVVCVDVTVENFNNILSFQYSMNFDATLLQFVEVIDPENIEDLNFGESGVANGNLGISWFDGDVMGITVPDGTLLYQVCFTILSGTTGTVTPVNFSGNPTAIEVVDGNEDPIVFGSNSGTVTIGTPLVPVDFTFPAIQGMAGETVCIPLTTENFNDVNSMQYSFCYDCTLLTFIEFTNPNATLTDVGTLNTGNPNPCQLNLTWFDDAINGETLPAGATIIEICFQISPSATLGQSSAVSICNTPTPLEVADENSNIIPTTLNSGSITVMGNPCMGAITVSNQIVTNVQPCAGANNGSIDITDAGGNGTGVNNYSWVNVDNPNAVLATTQDLMNVGAGTYEVTITGCAGADMETLTQGFTITEPTPIAINVTPTAVDCKGNNTGAISTIVGGGSGMGYTYTWSPSVAMGANPTSLPADNYFVTVSDSEGCTTTFGPIEISEPADDFTASTAVTNPACNGGTGTIVVNAQGGSPNYNYTINGGSSQTNPSFTGLMPGTYEIVSTDMNGCSVTNFNLEIVEPTEVVITEASSTPDVGGCEGSINIDIAGGNPGGFTFNWTGPSGPFSTQNINNLCAGEYCVTATDNVGGCTVTFCKTLIEPLTVTLVSSTDACFGECNGSAIIDIIGGGGSYMIDWSDGQNIINPDNLCSGTKTVTVTSGDGQMATLEVEIDEPASAVVINSPILVNPMSVTQCTGSITISPAGGYGGPTTTWSPPQSGTTMINNLCAGTYAVTVTDVNDCTVTATYTLESPDLEITNVNSTATSCNGVDDGTISFAVTGGTTPYTVVVMGGTLLIVDAGTTYNYSGVSGGVYLITVTDGAGEMTTTTVEVMEVAPIETEIIKVVDATSSTLGSIQIEQPTGGTPPYFYTWSGGPNIPAMNPDNLNPGVYSLTITDAVGCFVILENFATVYSLAITDSQITNPPCSDNPVGSVSITVTDVINNPPFNFAWENASGNSVGNNSTVLSSVTGGTYTVTVTDACGTSFVETFVVVADSNLELDVDITSFFNGFNIRCNGGDSGSVKANITNGTSPYTYAWSNGGMTPELDDLTAGIYAVTVVDAAGCSSMGEANIIEPDAITVNFMIDSISCNGQGDGFITANAVGGTIAGGYDYEWNNGDSDNTIGPIGPGNYSVEVTDGNDCDEDFAIPLPEPEELDFTFVTMPVTETELGSIQLFPVGGTKPYFYTWPAGVAGEDLVENLNFGTYAVIVTDANGCTKMNTGIKVDLNTDCFQGSPVITPNDDSLNDFFKISCNERVENLEIYNRWGQLVYEADTYSNEWGGTTRRGSDVPEGTYFYIFEFEDVNTGDTEQKRGYVTLLRN
ncbi:MAG: gliding motility-associated-like protein [Paraglaciecola sp.]|jgi:gliding motility-associated-like protein